MITTEQALDVAERLSVGTGGGKHWMELEAEGAETIRALAAENEKLREALKRISQIEDKMYGGDWDEIIEARAVARAALGETKS